MEPSGIISKAHEKRRSGASIQVQTFFLYVPGKKFNKMMTLDRMWVPDAIVD